MDWIYWLVSYNGKQFCSQFWTHFNSINLIISVLLSDEWDLRFLLKIGGISGLKGAGATIILPTQRLNAPRLNDKIWSVSENSWWLQTRTNKGETNQF